MIVQSRKIKDEDIFANLQTRMLPKDIRMFIYGNKYNLDEIIQILEGFEDFSLKSINYKRNRKKVSNTPAG